MQSRVYRVVQSVEKPVAVRHQRQSLPVPDDGRYYIENLPDPEPLSVRLLRAAKINREQFAKHFAFGSETKMYLEPAYYFAWYLINDPELSALNIAEALERVDAEVSRMFPDVDDPLEELLCVKVDDLMTDEEHEEKLQENFSVSGIQGYDAAGVDCWTSLENTWRKFRPDDAPRKEWREAFRPPVRDLLGEAVKIAEGLRVHSAKRRSPRFYDYRRGVAILYALRQLKGKEFGLGCRDFAACIFGEENRERKKGTANQWLRWLQDEGVLSRSYRSAQDPAEAWNNNEVYVYRFNDSSVVAL